MNSKLEVSADIVPFFRGLPKALEIDRDDPKVIDYFTFHKTKCTVDIEENLKKGFLLRIENDVFTIFVEWRPDEILYQVIKDHLDDMRKDQHE